MQSCEINARQKASDFLEEIPAIIEGLTKDLPLELKDLGEKMRSKKQFHNYKELASFIPPIKRYLNPQENISSQDYPVNNDRHGILVLENLRSAANVGNILRAAQFFACEEIILTGYTPDHHHPEVQKTALLKGIEFPIHWYFSTLEAIEVLKQKDYFIWGLETATNSKNLFEVELPLKSAFILGNEKFGLYQETLSHCDQILSLPSLGNKNSLNVGHAASISLYAYRKAIQQGAHHV